MPRAKQSGIKWSGIQTAETGTSGDTLEKEVKQTQILKNRARKQSWANSQESGHVRNTKRNMRPNWRSSKEFKATYIPQFQCICMVPSEESINPSGTDAQENMVEVQEYRCTQTASFSHEDSGDKYLSQVLEESFS